MNRELKQGKFKNFIQKYKLQVSAALSFIVPLIIYIKTLEPKLVGGDTSWYALQIPQMYILPPTGYPTFSILAKLMSMVPIGNLAYRLNLFSAIFGALTILFLFLAINKLVKNELISLASSLIFSFTLPYWPVANRLEFDTLNSFLVVLVIFAALTYNKNRKRSRLYFFFFCLGLSLTNHPIALFIAPAFIIYIIIINPKIFKNIKTVLLSILFFIVPLVSYIYIPIRSLQGYGPANTFQKFIYHITGRTPAGETHGGSFGDRSIDSALAVLAEYMKIIYKNFGIILIIIAIVGFIYLVRKNYRFAISSILVIIFSLTITSQYLGWAPENYAIDSMIIISFYIAFGFLSVLDLFNYLFSRLHKKTKNNQNVFKYSCLVVIFLFIIFQPFLLALTNYSSADDSSPEGIYLFWDEAFKNIKENSRLYVLSSAENIGAFVSLYEQSNKEIEFITHKDSRYNINDMKESLENGISVYFIGNEAIFLSNFDSKQIGQKYYWQRYNESLILYQATATTLDLDIEYKIDSKTQEFGKPFSVEYIIKNNITETTKITSFVLELPDSIELISVNEGGYINQYPAMSQGKWMWVSDKYFVDGKEEINIILNLRATRPGGTIVKFSLTANKIYVESGDLELEIKS